MPRRALTLVTLVALLLAGCATLPPYATEKSMADRARCLTARGFWVETQETYDCHAPPLPRAYPSPMPGGGFFITPNGEITVPPEVRR